MDALLVDLRRELSPLKPLLEDIEFLSEADKVALLDKAPAVFRAYQKEYGREYSGAESKERFRIFIKNLHAVVNGHGGEGSWVKGINTFSDRTLAEKQGYLGYNRSRVVRTDVDEPLPDMIVSSGYESFGWPLYPKSNSVSWRDRGALTAPLDQGTCGVCWAFSATAVLESHYFLRTGVLREMSVQQLVDCVYRTGGCEGGWYGDAYRYIKDNRLNSAYSYPLDLPDKGVIERGACRRSVLGAEGNIATKAGYWESTRSTKSLDGITVALDHHPVSGAMYAPATLFEYRRGLFSDPSCTDHLEQNNHAVVIAGYTESTFLIRNSWGADWGEEGYFRVRRSLTGNCGIANDVVWPTFYTITGEQDPDSPEFTCTDKYTWCSKYADRSCGVNSWFRRVCPYACSICSCRDVRGGCSTEDCSTESGMELCKRTCGLCSCPPGTTLCRTHCLPYWHEKRRYGRCSKSVAPDLYEDSL